MLTVESLEGRRLFASYALDGDPYTSDPAPVENEQYGSVIASQGDLILVGNANHDGLVVDVGEVQLIDTTNDVVTTIANPNPQANDKFGINVAFVGSKIAIASAENGGDGVVYIYELVGGNWVQATAPIVGPTGSADEAGFGAAMAAYGDNILISAVNDNSSGDGFVGLYNTDTGSEIRRYTDPIDTNPLGGNRFGEAIAVDLGATSGDTDDRILVASNDAANFVGYVVELNAVTGAAAQTYTEPTPSGFNGFGNALAFAGNTVLIGSTDMSTVYQFSRGDAAVVEEYTNSQSFSGFGADIVVSGDNVIISAEGETDESFLPVGAAYVFNHTTGALVDKIENPTPDPAAGETFGTAIGALSGGRFVVTNPLEDSNGVVDSGAVYVFAPADPPPPAEVAYTFEGGTLTVTGTVNAETIEIRSAGTAGVGLYVDGALINTFAGATKIIIDGGDETDTISVAGEVKIDADLYGGEGNDTITGGGGNDYLSGDAGDDLVTSRNASDIVLGGLGNDVLLGGNGRDLLIGGDGKDTISGDNAEDILVADSTDHDGIRSSLDSIRAIWTSDTSRDARVLQLESWFHEDNLTADAFIDILNGGNGLDYFVVDGNGELEVK